MSHLLLRTSPWQLSPPAPTCTNQNCLCVSISVISCLKVNVPLDEIMHSMCVPATWSTTSSSPGLIWNRSTYFMMLPAQTELTLGFDTTRRQSSIYMVRSVSAAKLYVIEGECQWCPLFREERMKLHCCYFCPIMQHHIEHTLPEITLPSSTGLMSSF